MGTGNTTYKFTWGFISESTTSNTETLTQTMSREMSRGIEHKGRSKSRTMSSSMAYTTQQYAEQTYTVTGGVEITTSCPPPTDPYDPSVGFFVYKVSTSANDAHAIQMLGVCRYGTGYWNIEPDCPFAACKDAACKECYDWY